MDGFVVTPFVICIDNREQAPWSFTGFKADAKDQGKPILVQTVTTHLKTGDYAIEGYEDRFAIERKSLEDGFNTFGQGRRRFEAELERLAAMDFAAVVLEADWTAIQHRPPRWSRMNPKAVVRSILSWQQRYTTVHWFPMPSRRHAEAISFRIIERFYKGVRDAICADEDDD